MIVYFCTSTKLYASIDKDGFDEVTLSEAATIFSEVTGKSTVIEGEFVSGVAEKQWLEEKGYEVDF